MMNKKQKLAIAVCIVGTTLGSSNAVFAADLPKDDNQAINAHSVVQNTNLISTPAYTTIITAEEIHDNHYKNLAEALSYANGVFVNPGTVNTSHLVVRIDGDDRVAVLVDGRRVNMDKGIMSGRASYDLDLLPSIMNVERIEIIHGAAGSYAINYDTPGGVINIVTKKGDKRETTIDFAGGERGAWKTKAITSGSLGDWSWVATGGFDNVDSMKYKASDGGNHEMPNSDNNRREMAYRIDKKLTDNSSLTFNYGHLSNDTGTWFSRHNPSDYNYEKLINHFSLTYDYKKDSVAPAYITYYHNYTQGDTYLPGLYNDHEDESSFSRWENTVDGIDWRDGWRVSKDHTITAGLMYRKTSVDNTSTNVNDPANLGANYNESISNTSVFLQSTRRFDKLTLTGTSLYNDNSKFGGKYVSSGALDYQADDKTTLFASLQKIYAVPSLDELYFNNRYIKGNADLRPESGQKGSLGVRYRLDERTNLNFNAFIADIDDPIGWSYDRTHGVFKAQNFENQKKHGFQFDVSHDFSDKYSASFSYARTITHTDFGEGNQVDANAVAPNSYKATVSYKDDHWHNNLMMTAATGRDDRAYSGDYFVVDANFNYKIDEQWTTYLKLANITNESYENIGSFFAYEGDCPAPGRTVLMGMEYTF